MKIALGLDGDVYRKSYTLLFFSTFNDNLFTLGHVLTL